MSSLKVASINHPSAPSGGLSIGTDGNVAGAGLDLIVSQSFTAASTVSVNNCFTSTYDNYRVLVDFTPSTTGQEVRFRLRSGGVDAVTAYDYTLLNAQNTTVAGTGVAATTSARISATFGTTSGHFCSLDIASPFTSASTRANYMSLRPSAGAIPLVEFGVAFHATASSYDGFTIYPASGTITGTIRVYGYRN